MLNRITKLISVDKVNLNNNQMHLFKVNLFRKSFYITNKKVVPFIRKIPYIII